MHESVSSVTDPFRKEEGTLMDTGKILIGIALVMFSAALMVTPSSAAGSDASRGVGNGGAVYITGSVMVTDLPQSAGADGTPVISPERTAAGTWEDR
jgi:hypothetical protein